MHGYSPWCWNRVCDPWERTVHLIWIKISSDLFIKILNTNNQESHRFSLFPPFPTQIFFKDFKFGTFQDEVTSPCLTVKCWLQVTSVNNIIVQSN